MSDEIRNTEKDEQDIERLQARSGGMLPGIAGIAMFMIFMTILNAFAALRGTFGSPTAKYSVLGVCTLLAIGVFGLLRLRKWGWAIVTAGCLLLTLAVVRGTARTREVEGARV